MVGAAFIIVYTVSFFRARGAAWPGVTEAGAP